MSRLNGSLRTLLIEQILPLTNDPGNSARIFVSTDVGVFVSFDSGSNFTAADRGMPLGAVINDLETTANPPALVAASYGRGARLLSLDAETIFKHGFE